MSLDAGNVNILLLRRALLIGALWSATTVAGHGENDSPGPASRQFQAALSAPPLLRAFLFRMPKGGDIHQHISGSAYAEDLIDAGAKRGLCVDAKSATVRPPPCEGADLEPLAKALSDTALYTRLVDAWSMRSFQESAGNSGHDHFFNAFALFSAANDLATNEAQSADRAGRQHLQYLELMTTFQGEAVRDLGRELTWTGDFAAARQRLMELGLADLVAKAGSAAQSAEKQRKALLKCGTPEASPGCAVTVRYLEQVTRTAPPNVVFAQALYGFLVSQAEPLVVGINFVAPEDDVSALANYHLHMQMLDYLHGVMPDVGIALHAGELTLGLVAPQELHSHIRQAVELGHAQRIGHGVDVMFEDDAVGLLHEMAARHVAVEINLTSNAAILGVKGRDHPFPVYLAAHVPAVITTDDEGIERTDMTNELQLAVTTYRLDYATLVSLERNSLEYAFIRGPSLWASPGSWVPVRACAGAVGARTPPPSCAAFLLHSDKARLQWQLEQQFQEFDKTAPELRIH
jgi:hypothetical protein